MPLHTVIVHRLLAMVTEAGSAGAHECEPKLYYRYREIWPALMSTHSAVYTSADTKRKTNNRSLLQRFKLIWINTIKHINTKVVNNFRQKNLHFTNKSLGTTKLTCREYFEYFFLSKRKKNLRKLNIYISIYITFYLNENNSLVHIMWAS